MDFLRRIITVVVFMGALMGLHAQDATTIREAFKESYAFESEGNYSGAIRSLREVYDPSSYHINVRLGWLNYLIGQFIESAAYYQKGIELKPYAIEARLGLTYPASSMGNWAQVKEQYIKILEIDPQNTKANYYLGLMHYETGEYMMAAKYFEKVANLYPFDSESVLMYAWANFQIGKTREAKILFNEVLIADPENESALEGLDMIK